MGFRTTLAAVVGTAVAFLAAASLVPLVAAAAIRGCATTADIGTFVGWCACSSVVTPRQVVSPPTDSSSGNCDVIIEPTTTFYCDKAGLGNCDLQCAEPIWECTGPVLSGRCACAKGGVRAVQRYNGPLDLANMPNMPNMPSMP
ncbi:hypothetical protein MMPV_002227 [Pyropia vietnamensis]